MKLVTSNYGADFTVRSWSKIEHSECANSGCIMVWKAIVKVETGRAGISLRAIKLAKVIEQDWANPTTSIIKR